MNSTTPLTGSQLRTYKRIFQHPISHNLEWRSLYALLGKLGNLTKEHNGNVRVIRNGEILILHPPHAKDLAEMKEIMAVRHFLERSETMSPEMSEKEIHWLLVIDHHEARVFRAEIEGAAPTLILPHPPIDFFRHAQDSKECSRGQEKPDPNSFFEPVAKALYEPGQILIFGTGTGMSNEMNQFIEWVKLHHPEVNKRIIGSLIIDEHHLSEGELLAKAREFYANH